MPKKQWFSIANRRVQSDDPNAQQEAFLSVTEDTEDEFGFIKRKRGFMPVSLEKAELALEAANSGKRKFILVGQPDRQNLYQVQMINPADVPAAAKAVEGALEH